MTVCLNGNACKRWIMNEHGHQISYYFGINPKIKRFF